MPMRDGPDGEAPDPEIIAEYEAMADIPGADVLAGDRIMLLVSGSAVLLRTLDPAVLALMRKDLGHALEQLALDDPRVQKGERLMAHYTRWSGASPQSGKPN